MWDVFCLFAPKQCLLCDMQGMSRSNAGEIALLGPKKPNNKKKLVGLEV